MDETLTPLSDGDAGTHVARPTGREVGRVELVQLYVGIVRERGDRSRSREIVHDDGTPDATSRRNRRCCSSEPRSPDVAVTKARRGGADEGVGDHWGFERRKR